MEIRLKQWTKTATARRGAALGKIFAGALVLSILLTTGGCHSTKPAAQKQDQFFTSGSKEADQRASQRMARAEQLSGPQGDVKKAKTGEKASGPASDTSTNAPQAAQAEKKLTLFERLGAQPGISNIVADFTPRVLG